MHVQRNKVSIFFSFSNYTEMHVKLNIHLKSIIKDYTPIIWKSEYEQSFDDIKNSLFYATLRNLKHFHIEHIEQDMFYIAQQKFIINFRATQR